MKIDLHIHSTYGDDSSAEPEEVVQKALEVGLDGIAFTEHNSYAASEPVERLKEKYRGSITILRGAEYASTEGHFLLFGVNDDDLTGTGLYAPLKEIIKVVNERNGVIIAAHPFRHWSPLHSNIEVLKNICAIEAYNGHNKAEENENALSLAIRLNLPTTGGSDTHSVDEVGACYTEFFAEVTEGNLVEVLRSGKYKGICPGRLAGLK